jgi:hypothetical protein
MAQWDFGVVAFQIADDFVPGVARLAGLGHVKRDLPSEGLGGAMLLLQ